ncbi:MAG: D-2-hydroxyacid dehydrogenase [Spirochaetota bacterium]
MNIVVLDGYTLNPGDNPWDLVEALGNLTVYDRTPSERVVERAYDADVVLSNKTPITREAIEELPKLKFIGVLATGYDVIDVSAARERDIDVSNVPVYGTDSVAEYVYSLVLNHFRRPVFHSEQVRSGEWQRAGDFSFWRTPLAELAGKTIGIVGFGRIGQRVGEVARSFKMSVIAFDVVHAAAPNYEFEWHDLESLARQSDIVTLHCKQTTENTGMINFDFLSKMKLTTFFVNTARGGLVVEADLARALNEGIIGGAAVDVVSEEPIKAENPLLSAKNVIVTPHIAWATLEARRRLMQTTAENILAFQDGAPQNVVNAG